MHSNRTPNLRCYSAQVWDFNFFGHDFTFFFTLNSVRLVFFVEWPTGKYVPSGEDVKGHTSWVARTSNTNGLQHSRVAQLLHDHSLYKGIWSLKKHSPTNQTAHMYYEGVVRKGIRLSPGETYHELMSILLIQLEDFHAAT